MVEDPVDRGARGHERDDAHLARARGTSQRVDLEDLPQPLGPASPRFAERERHRARDGDRRVRGPHAPAPRPAHAIGVVAVMARPPNGHSVCASISTGRCRQDRRGD